MNFKYPMVIMWVLLITLLMITVLFFLKKNGKYRGGVRAANSSLIMQLPEFRKARKKQKILSMVVLFSLFLAIASTACLAARPYKLEELDVGVRKRDIMLCMDTGFYLDNLNAELIDAIEDVVRGLDGDRFGVSVYSSSSLLMVPLTDDYEYVIDKLEELKEFFTLGIKLDQYYGGYLQEHEELSDEMQAEYEIDQARMQEFGWLRSAVSWNRRSKGSFLVGDGLASCLYSFPMLDEQERSRVIILSTDNSKDKNGNPIVSLSGACDLCAEHDVTVFGLYRGAAAYSQTGHANGFFLSSIESDSTYESSGPELQTCVEKTGGKFYEYGVGQTPAEIVKDVSAQEAMQVKSIVLEKQTDTPELFIILLSISLLLLSLGAIRMYM